MTHKMESLKEKQNIGCLLDVYGALLTTRQRYFFDLHYNEDLSLGEIAEMENISRQAVHDTIQQGKKSLIRFEEALHLLRNGTETHVPQSHNENLQSIKTLILDISRMVKDDIIYDTAQLRRKVAELRKQVGMGE